jgi:hypothetical protein
MLSVVRDRGDEHTGASGPGGHQAIGIDGHHGRVARFPVIAWSEALTGAIVAVSWRVSPMADSTTDCGVTRTPWTAMGSVGWLELEHPDAASTSRTTAVRKAVVRILVTWLIRGLRCSSTILGPPAAFSNDCMC